MGKLRMGMAETPPRFYTAPPPEWIDPPRKPMLAWGFGAFPSAFAGCLLVESDG